MLFKEEAEGREQNYLTIHDSNATTQGQVNAEQSALHS